MEKWKEEILEAYRQGKKIQTRSGTQDWHDFVPQNQLDRPNVDHGYTGEWRIKPDYAAEREQLLKDSGRDDVTPMMKTERFYTKSEMLIFAGFCLGKRMFNPLISGSEMWDAWEKEFENG